MAAERVLIVDPRMTSTVRSGSPAASGPRNMDQRAWPLPLPPANEHYYRDIAVYAYPVTGGATQTTLNTTPTVTSSQPGTDVQFLATANGRGARVGELDEEMVFESKVGETFVLGASTWRIEEITFDKVLVSPAPGEPHSCGRDGLDRRKG